MARTPSHVFGRTAHWYVATSSFRNEADSHGVAAAAAAAAADDDDDTDGDAGASVRLSAAWAPHACWQTVGQKSSAIARCERTTHAPEGLEGRRGHSLAVECTPAARNAPTHATQPDMGRTCGVRKGRARGVRDGMRAV